MATRSSIGTHHLSPIQTFPSSPLRAILEESITSPPRSKTLCAAASSPSNMPRRVRHLMTGHGEYKPNKFLQMLLLLRRALLGGQTAVSRVYVFDGSD
ncbi:unnamed protein product [Tuber aestivum]|uniref:Uncharacterized protein n=1 Tax=Tuber aestivum TaxID=59557 RepID=A0A292Q098_9PEZI|nr:unnamed protein product [Tuber aestivum]